MSKIIDIGFNRDFNVTSVYGKGHILLLIIVENLIDYDYNAMLVCKV